MAQPKKKDTTKAIRAQMKRAGSVEALSKIIRSASLRTAGFKIDPDGFDDLELEKLVVLETLVVRLREVIEEDAHFRESAGGKPEEEEEDFDFEYDPGGDVDEIDDEQ